MLVYCFAIFFKIYFKWFRFTNVHLFFDSSIIVGQETHFVTDYITSLARRLYSTLTCNTNNYFLPLLLYCKPCIASGVLLYSS